MVVRYFKKKIDDWDDIAITEQNLTDYKWWIRRVGNIKSIADKAIKFRFRDENGKLTYSNMSNFILDGERLSDDSNELLKKLQKNQNAEYCEKIMRK